MRKNFLSVPYTQIYIGYVYGFYNADGQPTFNTYDSPLSIENNQINWIFPETIYNLLEGVSEFSLSPTLMVQNKGVVRIGYPNYSPEPKDGKAYGMEKAEKINAPFLEGMPLVMECIITCCQKKTRFIGSYEDNDIKLSAKIVNVNVEKSFISENDNDINLARILGLKGFVNEHGQETSC